LRLLGAKNIMEGETRLFIYPRVEYTFRMILVDQRTESGDCFSFLSEIVQSRLVDLV
jgi:hypothetical protein